jgi:hypothetical protein
MKAYLSEITNFCDLRLTPFPSGISPLQYSTQGYMERGSLVGVVSLFVWVKPLPLICESVAMSLIFYSEKSLF